MNSKIDREKLIALFAQHSAEEIFKEDSKRLKDALGKKKFQDLAQDEEYQKLFSTLTALRDKLDSAIAGTTGAEQVRYCLMLLQEIKENEPKEHHEMLEKLIKKGYQKNWSLEERQYYQSGYAMLCKWKDYFLSYTNRNCIETNNDFKEVLLNVFGDADFEKNKEKVNYLARLIFHYLKQHNLHPFFDQDNMKCGDDIKEKIFAHCRSTFAFVQLIEPGIFQAENKGQENWCYREFQAFDNWSSQNPVGDCKRFYFLLTEKIADIFPARLPGEYEPWKTCIEGKIHIQDLKSMSNVEIGKTHIQDLKSMSKEKIKLKVWEIAQEIVKARQQVLASYLE